MARCQETSESIVERAAPMSIARCSVEAGPIGSDEEDGHDDFLVVYP